jgi:hypothetical protein
MHSPQGPAVVSSHSPSCWVSSFGSIQWLWVWLATKNNDRGRTRSCRWTCPPLFSLSHLPNQITWRVHACPAFVPLTESTDAMQACRVCVCMLSRDDYFAFSFFWRNSAVCMERLIIHGIIQCDEQVGSSWYSCKRVKPFGTLMFEDGCESFVHCKHTSCILQDELGR